MLTTCPALPVAADATAFTRATAAWKLAIPLFGDSEGQSSRARSSTDASGFMLRCASVSTSFSSSRSLCHDPRSVGCFQRTRSRSRFGSEFFGTVVLPLVLERVRDLLREPSGFGGGWVLPCFRAGAVIVVRIEEFVNDGVVAAGAYAADATAGAGPVAVAAPLFAEVALLAVAALVEGDLSPVPGRGGQRGVGEVRRR